MTLPEEVYKAAKNIGENLRKVVADRKFSVIDNIAKSTDVVNFIVSLYAAYRLLVSKPEDVYGKELKESTEKLIERLKENDDPQNVSLIASLIGVYALSSGLIELAKSKKKEGGKKEKE